MRLKLGEGPEIVRLLTPGLRGALRAAECSRMSFRLGRLAALDAAAWVVGVPLLAAAVLGPIVGFAGWPDGLLPGGEDGTAQLAAPPRAERAVKVLPVPAIAARTARDRRPARAEPARSSAPPRVLAPAGTTTPGGRTAPEPGPRSAPPRPTPAAPRRSPPPARQSGSATPLPVELPPVKPPPVEAPSVDVPPVDLPPVDLPPVELSPLPALDVPPVDLPPVDLPPLALPLR